MAQQLRPQVTNDGVTNFAIDDSDSKTLFLVTPNAEKVIVVPEDMTTVSITSDLGVYFMRIGSTPITMPAADLIDTDVSMSPSIRKVSEGETLRFVSGRSGFLEVSFYS